MFKHAIVGYSDHIFSNLYVDVLINKCSVPNENIVFIELGDVSITQLPENRISVLQQCNLTSELISELDTITFISLNKGNSFFTKFLIDNYPGISEKIYVHLTDDEVDRWDRAKRKYGSLSAAKSRKITSDCVYSLRFLQNYIAPERPFKLKLENILEHQKFNLYDARDPFFTMPCSLMDKVKKLYEEDRTKAEKKILIGPKKGAFGLLFSLRVLCGLGKLGQLSEYKYLLFTGSRARATRIVIDLLALYFRIFKNQTLDISYCSPTNNVTYNVMVMSCANLILQGRGSMTTARTYMTLGRGNVYVAKDSPNYTELTYGEGVEVLGYKSIRELVSLIVKQKSNVRRNMIAIGSRYKEKYKVLESIYK